MTPWDEGVESNLRGILILFFYTSPDLSFDVVYLHDHNAIERLPLHLLSCPSYVRETIPYLGTTTSEPERSTSIISTM